MWLSYSRRGEQRFSVDNDFGIKGIGSAALRGAKRIADSKRNADCGTRIAEYG
jgi:hypothetical protein